MVSQITSFSTVCATVCSDADQSKHRSSALLAFVRGIHRSPHKRPVTRKIVPCNDAISEMACEGLTTPKDFNELAEDCLTLTHRIEHEHFPMQKTIMHIASESTSIVKRQKKHLSDCPRRVSKRQWVLKQSRITITIAEMYVERILTQGQVLWNKRDKFVLHCDMYLLRFTLGETAETSFLNHVCSSLHGMPWYPADVYCMLLSMFSM